MFTVDLHSHILPGLDDGARDPEESLALIRSEAAQGVQSIVLTPHFDPLTDEIGDFVQRRNTALAMLDHTLAASELSGKIGFRTAAEVRFSPMLTELPGLDQLCISGTKVLLVEFSFHRCPEFVREVFSKLQMNGFILLIAHAERYVWLRKEPELLYDLVCNGAYAQFNADSVTGDRDALTFIRKMLKNGLLHGIGSDTHNMELRPPALEKAAKLLSKNPGEETVYYLDNVGKTLLSGNVPFTYTPDKPRKSFLDHFRN